MKEACTDCVYHRCDRFTDAFDHASTVIDDIYKKLSNNSSAQAFLGTDNAEVCSQHTHQLAHSSTNTGTIPRRNQLQLYCSWQEVNHQERDSATVHVMLP